MKVFHVTLHCIFVQGCGKVVAIDLTSKNKASQQKNEETLLPLLPRRPNSKPRKKRKQCLFESGSEKSASTMDETASDASSSSDDETGSDGDDGSGKEPAQKGRASGARKNSGGNCVFLKAVEGGTRWRRQHAIRCAMRNFGVVRKINLRPGKKFAHVYFENSSAADLLVRLRMLSWDGCKIIAEAAKKPRPLASEGRGKKEKDKEPTTATASEGKTQPESQQASARRPQQATQPDASVAIFVDAENLGKYLSQGGAAKLIQEARGYGSPIVRRAFGDWSQVGVNAHQKSLRENGFDFIHTPPAVSGKGAADIAMVVDAMATLYTMPTVSCFVLATGDSDFSPLFKYLNQSGRTLVGVGPRSILSRVVANTVHKYVYTDGAGGKDAPRRHQGKKANARHKRGATNSKDRAMKAKVTSRGIKKGKKMRDVETRQLRAVTAQSRGIKKGKKMKPKKGSSRSIVLKGKVSQKERSEGFPRSSSSSSKKELLKKGRLEKSGARQGHGRKTDTQGA
jgi:hypothetical protein